MGGTVPNTLRATLGDRYEGVYRIVEGSGLDTAVARQVIENRGYLNVTEHRRVDAERWAFVGTVINATDAGNLFGAWIDDAQGSVLQLEGWTKTGTFDTPLTFLHSGFFGFEEALQAGATWLEEQRRKARQEIGEAAGGAIEGTAEGAVQAARAGAERAAEGVLRPFLGDSAGRFAGLAVWIGLAVAAWWALTRGAS